ncbi:MAG: hypothetical protein H6721_08655 [Sandaracinus sp.]|nr:hypothetical protein [Myxococcales bacterium]MCB9603097.1 hypothetical protein [Sandaracinus sp.]MCB9613326.1 hypothetical protein [Sandaracinus sp.]MCB9632187.1 hypothetical protein [Sandaracinus sp.]
MNERHEAFGRGMARALRVALWLGLAACARSHERPGEPVAEQQDASDALADATSEDAEHETAVQADADLRGVDTEQRALDTRGRRAASATGVVTPTEVRSNERSRVAVTIHTPVTPSNETARGGASGGKAPSTLPGAADAELGSGARATADDTRLSRCARMRSRPTWCREAWLEPSP